MAERRRTGRVVSLEGGVEGGTIVIVTVGEIVGQDEGSARLAVGVVEMGASFYTRDVMMTWI